MAKFLKLEDVEKISKERSDTFFIPSAAERKSQKVGALVRLHFVLDNPKEWEPQAERMWVTITQEQGFFKPYKGVLESNPACIEGLNPGDEILFKACHIAQTMIKKEDPRWIDSADLKALVSKMCLEKGEAVRFLYREKADQKEDSGWRMFSGHESSEYTEDSSNITLLNVGFMLDRDPSLLEPLKENIGAVFERDEMGAPWRKITDWVPGA